MNTKTETLTNIDYVSFTADEIKEIINLSHETSYISNENERVIYDAFMQALTDSEDTDADNFANDVSAAVSCKVFINKDSSFTAIQALCNLTTDSINITTRELERETRNRFFYLSSYYVWAYFIDDPAIDLGQVRQFLNWLLMPLERRARAYWRDHGRY